MYARNHKATCNGTLYGSLCELSDCYTNTVLVNIT